MLELASDNAQKVGLFGHHIPICCLGGPEGWIVYAIGMNLHHPKLGQMEWTI